MIRPCRIVIDINVWVAFLIATQHGRSNTAAQSVVAMARNRRIGDRPAQLVASLEMIDALTRVLCRFGFSRATAEDFGQTILDIMKAGPDALDPYLLLSGRDQLAMHDREDAGVLAAAIAARADLVVTDNLRDFETNDRESIDTQVAVSKQGARQLFGIIHQREDSVALVVAHPIDVVRWSREMRDITPDMLRAIRQA